MAYKMSVVVEYDFTSDNFEVKHHKNNRIFSTFNKLAAYICGT